MTWEEAWRWGRRNLWWLVPLLVIVVNLVLVSTYRSLYSGRVEALQEALAEERSQLETMEAQARQLEALVERAEDARSGIEYLSEEAFAPESARFTQVVREVRSLADQAGVVPERISYPEEPLGEYGLIKRSLLFNVEGDYRQLRRFINFLELSESFLILESLGLQDDDSNLRIRVALSTLFSGRDATLVPDTGEGAP